MKKRDGSDLADFQSDLAEELNRHFTEVTNAVRLARLGFMVSFINI